MKRAISFLLTLLMLLSMLTGLSTVAFAEEAESAALEIYTQTGEAEPELVKSYKLSELDALKETAKDGYTYVYWKGEDQKQVVATELVSLDALLSDAGTTFGAGDELKFTCSDGPYPKGDFSYESMAERGYDTENNAVPSAFALTYGNTLEAQENTGKLRFVCGATAAEIEAKSAAGNRMPSDVIAVTIVKPEDAEPAALELYTQTGEGEPELVKAYKAGELAALAETKAEGYEYDYYRGDAHYAVAATELITLDALLSDADTEFSSGDSLKFNTDTGPYTKGNFDYENIAARGVDADGNTVPTALALTWNSGELNAENTFAALAETVYNSGSLRFVSGMTAEEAENKTAAGNRMPSGVISITIVKPEPAETPALEVYTKTGDAEPELVKSYAASELAELKETTETGYCYVYWKGDDMKTIVATEYVTLDALLSDAGTTFGAGDELKFTCSDGPYPKGDFSYESMAERGYDTENNAVPSAFALTYGNTLEAQENTGKLRFVCGATAAEIEAKSAAGNRMPSDVIAVTIVKAEEPPKPVAVFDDVAKDAYYYDAVYWAVGKEITKGTSEKTFSPDKDCTRAEMVTFLWRAAGSPAYVIDGDPLMVIPFQDVKSTDYFCQAVLWAVHNGITKGTSETTFSPDKTVSRAEAVTFLFRMAKAEKPEKAASFTDVPADAYYADAVAWACAKEITLGTSATTFSPNNPCLRAQIVTFLYRYFNAK